MWVFSKFVFVTPETGILQRAIMKHRIDSILSRASAGEGLSPREALLVYEDAPAADIFMAADVLRRRSVDDPGTVTWQIDRNVNITNVCISGCRFCNFHCKPHEFNKSYVITLEELAAKTQETLRLGGDQLLLQGGLHPELGIGFYEDLFRGIKGLFPQIKLHALGAPEISHIARISALTVSEVLVRLRRAGLDSLPGAGAEILCDEVRKKISPNKPSAQEWTDVMREAHRQNFPTSATMMYGHVETKAQRIEHLFRIRDIQAERPEGSYGFIAFIPWIFRGTGTELERRGISPRFSPLEYLRTVAISRLVLNNIRNIQASWLTVGKATAQMALHCGANDMGSIMIEENVVSSAGARNRFDAEGIQQAIREAGFTPRLRNQLYEDRTEGQDRLFR